MEEKEIDINNEEQILKKCGCFDYFYNCEECSRELCMFYNDILSHKIKQENNFNTRQAIIDLGRIAITLNQQDKQIKELEEENKELEIKLDKCGTELVNAESLVSYLENENQQLRQQLAIFEKALELACERVKYFEEMQDKEMGFYEFFGYDSDYDLKAIIEQYKQQAKEMLENE